MNVDFMFNFLPSFYKDFLIDANGQNILVPLFEQYTKCISDAIFQAQQLSQVPYLETCPLFILEYYKTINLKQSNCLGGNQYQIESDTIGFSDLYLDGNLTIPISPITFIIGQNPSTGIRYIEFSAPLAPNVNILYTKNCYKDKSILFNSFGKLLNYQPVFPFVQYGPDYLTQQQSYKNQLLGLLYCSVNGQTFQSIKQSLSIYLGLQYAAFNAIVRDNSGTSITLENISNGNLVVITGNINSILTPGVLLNKYDILENDIFLIYDILSDPARFTQYLLANYSENLLSLLNIDIANDERYAFLTYDSLVSFDQDNIYWDMGNNTGISHTKDGSATTVSYPEDGLVTRFDTYNDSRFNSQKIYEMFRNIFIVEFIQTPSNYDDTNYFLTRFKPINSKYLIR